MKYEVASVRNEMGQSFPLDSFQILPNGTHSSRPICLLKICSVLFHLAKNSQWFFHTNGNTHDTFPALFTVAGYMFPALELVSSRLPVLLQSLQVTGCTSMLFVTGNIL